MVLTKKPGESIYLVLSIWILVLVIVGFWPTYFGPVLEGEFNMNPIFHLHAVVFLGWILLFVTQTSLAFVRRLDLHRKLGLASVAYGVVILTVGLWTTFYGFFERLELGEVRAAHASLVIPFFDLLLFVIFFTAAIYFRSKPAIHKRMMIATTLVFVGPAVGRMGFLGSIPLILLVLLSPILFGIIFDLVKERKVHKAYVVGLVIFLISLVRLPLRESEAWFQFSQKVFGFLV